VYIPDIGRGFVKDDFHWIEAGRRVAAHPAALFSAPQDFYRPLIAITFAVDARIHGLDPRWYGYENFLLYVACAVALWQLARTAGLAAPAAALAAFVWAINPHGINMAVIWISGRTALWLTLGALVAARSILRGRYLTGAVALACALAAKEEAVLLPIVVLCWTMLLSPDGWRASRWTILAALLVPLGAYLIARTQSGAFGPMNAPSFYQFTIAPAVVARNAFEYLDRGATASLAVLAIAAIATGVRPSIDPRRRRLLLACACWFAGGYGLTLFLPVRSSLYAVLPSAGAALACAALVESMATAATVHRRWLPFAAALAAATLALLPVYSARNDRWVEPARLSQRTLLTLAPRLNGLPSDGAIVLEDEPAVEPTFIQAFGVFAGDAIRLETGRPFDAWIDPPPPGWQLSGLRAPSTVLARFELHHGSVVEAPH
jgi:hypothetical protein